MTTRRARTTPEETPEAPESQPTVSGGVWLADVEIDRIHVPPGYIESEYDDLRRESLAQSIEKVGQDSAINVVELSEAEAELGYCIGDLVLTGGKHRMEDAAVKGQTHIRAEIKRGTYADARRANRANALNQSKPSLWSEIEGIGRAIGDEGLTIDDLLEEGHSASIVESRYRIWENAGPELIAAIQQKYIDKIGAISLIAGVQDPELQSEVLHEYTEGPRYMTEEQLREYIAGLYGVEPEESEEEPEAGTHEVSFQASDQPQGRERKAITCDCGCAQTDEIIDLQTMRLCPQSVQRFRDVLEGAPEGMIILPAGLAREACNILPGVALGVPVADRIEKFLEGEGDE